MARKKKEEIQSPEVEIAPEPKVEVAAEESEAKKQFRATIEIYKARNPHKYNLKKDAFEKQLNSL